MGDLDFGFVSFHSGDMHSVDLVCSLQSVTNRPPDLEVFESNLCHKELSGAIFDAAAFWRRRLRRIWFWLRKLEFKKYPLYPTLIEIEGCFSNITSRVGFFIAKVNATDYAYQLIIVEQRLFTPSLGVDQALEQFAPCARAALGDRGVASSRSRLRVTGYVDAVNGKNGVEISR